MFISHYFHLVLNSFQLSLCWGQFYVLREVFLSLLRLGLRLCFGLSLISELYLVYIGNFVSIIFDDSQFEIFHLSCWNIFDFEVLFICYFLYSEFTHHYVLSVNDAAVWYLDELGVGLVLVPTENAYSIEYFRIVGHVGCVDNAILR